MKNVEDVYPLSPMQHLMLLHTLAAPRSKVLLRQLCYTLHGELAVPEFIQAWQHLTTRHTALRTAFIWEGLEKPLQVVRQQATLTCQQEDWRHYAITEQHEKLKAFLLVDAEQGIDLYRAPLMRLSLIRSTQETSYLVWSIHHLIVDGWCAPIIMEELKTCYEALCQGRTIDLAPAPCYRQYIAWLQQQDLAPAEKFWRERFAGFQVPPSFAAGRAAGAAEEIQYEEQQLSVSGELIASLRSVLRQHKLTLNTLFQGAWALLLSWHSGTNDVVFGVTTSGRPAELAGVEAMLGTFINNLPIRVQLSADESVMDWLKEHQEDQLRLRPYEHYSLTQVQEWSGVPQWQPLFETLLIFQNLVEATSSRTSSLDMRSLSSTVRTAYPLTILATEVSTELMLRIIYDRDRFEATAITGLLEQLRTILVRMGTNPDQRLSQILQPRDGETQVLLTPQAKTQPQVGQSTGQMLLGRHKMQRKNKEACILPRSVLEAQLARIWEDIFDIRPIGARDNFFALGGHSRLAMLLLTRLEKRFGQTLHPAILAQSATVEQLAVVLREKHDITSLSPLIPIQTSGMKRPLFYVATPDEGMGSFSYTVNSLGLGRPCYGLQPLGLGGPDGPYNRVPDIAARFIQEIRTIQPEGPYFLSGACLGGLIAIEIAHQLQMQAQTVACLVVFDVRYPAPYPLSVQVKQYVTNFVKRTPKEKIALIRRIISGWLIQARVKVYLNTGRPIPSHLQEPYRYNYSIKCLAEASSSYSPPQPYKGQIKLFRSALWDSEDWNFTRWDTYWEQVAAGGLELYPVAASHLQMTSESVVRTWIGQLRACLDAADVNEKVEGQVGMERAV